MEKFLVKPATAATESPNLEVITLRRQVETLTAENQKLKKEITTLKKRVASTPSLDAPTFKKARTAGQKKKIFEKWCNALTRE